jgi:hypothetical protein
MAIRPHLSGRISPELELSEIILKLSPSSPPVLELKGRFLTRDRTTGRFSDVTATLLHLPPSALAFIADMKAVLAAKQTTTENGKPQ